MSKRAEQEASARFTEYLAATETADAAGLAPARGAPEWPELAELALELRQLPVESPSPVFRAAGYQALMQEIQRVPARRVCLQSLAAGLLNGRSRVAWAGALAAVLCLSVGGAVFASTAAMPGDPLYGLKTAVEDMRLAATPPDVDVELRVQFAQRRLDELSKLLAAGRLDDIPSAAVDYSAQVTSALDSLAAVASESSDVRVRVTAELDKALEAQAGQLDGLAARVPSLAKPALEKARSASSDARNALRQPPPAPLRAATPSPQNPTTDAVGGPAGNATPTPTSTALATATATAAAVAPPAATPGPRPAGGQPLATPLATDEHGRRAPQPGSTAPATATAVAPPASPPTSITPEAEGAPGTGSPPPTPQVAPPPTRPGSQPTPGSAPEPELTP